MPRRELRFSASAARDLERLLNYIIEAAGTPLTAHAYVERIRARCATLTETPHVGTNHDATRPGLRTVPFESVIIAFEVTDRLVRIRRIFGAAQDYLRLL